MSSSNSALPTTSSRTGLRGFLHRRNVTRCSGQPTLPLVLNGAKGGRSDTKVVPDGNPSSSSGGSQGARHKRREGLGGQGQSIGKASSSQPAAAPVQNGDPQMERPSSEAEAPPVRFASPFRLCTVARQLMRSGQKKIAQGRTQVKVKRPSASRNQRVKQEPVEPEPEPENTGYDGNQNQVVVDAQPQEATSLDDDGDPRDPAPEDDPSQVDMAVQDLVLQLQECVVTLSRSDAEETMPSVEGEGAEAGTLSSSSGKRRSQRRRKPRMALNPVTGKLEVVRSLDPQKRKRSQKQTVAAGSGTGRKEQKKSSCGFCQKEYGDSMKLERHIQKHCRRNPSYPYKCEGVNCGMYFRCPANFNRHKRSCAYLKQRPISPKRHLRTRELPNTIENHLMNHLCSGSQTDSKGACHTRGAAAKRRKMTASRKSGPSSSSNNCMETLDKELGRDDGGEDPVVGVNSDGNGSPSPSQNQRWGLKECIITLTRCDHNEIPVPAPVMKDCYIVLKRCDDNGGDGGEVSNKNEDHANPAEVKRNIGKGIEKKMKGRGKSSRRRFF